MSGSFSNIKRVLLVLSGKGGVGKSTVAVQLALTLRNSGKKVGLLDIDLCGPSIPHMLKLNDCDVHQSEEGWLPVPLTSQKANVPDLQVMSIGFLQKDPNKAVIWRGPKKSAMIKQFLIDVNWGELDYLIIDTPPGTSDEHIAVVECLQQVCKCDGAVLVTTPQALSLNDVRREITFCKRANIPVVGIIENMSGYVCPHCSECTNVFSKGGGENLANYANVPYLGSIPIDAKITECGDKGESFVDLFQESEIVGKLSDIIVKINETLSE